MKNITLSIVFATIVASLLFASPKPVVRAATVDEEACAAMTTTIYQQDSTATKRTLFTQWKSEADKAISYGFDDTKGAVFKVSMVPKTKLVPIHRLYNPTSTDFIWLAEGGELNGAVTKFGYTDQGLAFYASETPLPCTSPVYRVQKGATHKYTVSAQERDAYLASGWFEGAATFYVVKTKAPRPILPDPVKDADGKFSFAVLPDTQGESHEGLQSRLYKRANWIVANKEARDYRFILHTGDIVNWGWLDLPQYASASAGMKQFESAGLPYFINIGNHDTRAVGWDGVPGSRLYGGAAYSGNPECAERFKGVPDGCSTSRLVRETQEFNQTFPVERFGSVTGQYEANKVDNVYSTFEAGGKKFMVLTLELWARQGALDWASQVIANHPNYNVIVMTHSFLDGSGNIVTDNGGYGATSPRHLFDTVLAKYPNVKMVFSGHTGQHISKVYTGVQGNKIPTFLQAMHAPNPQQPMRDVEIDVKNNTLTTKMIDAQNGSIYSNSTTTIDQMNWI